MLLTDDEKRLLDGKEGPARQKAMELLYRYGEALGAERFVNTNNVCGVFGVSGPFLRDFALRENSMDAVFSEFCLDSGETFEIPKVKAFSCHLIQGMDPDHWEIQGLDYETYRLHKAAESFCVRIGINMMNTCAPYLVGNVPLRGEHCAWMESSATIFINSVLGARTNTEGRESAACSMLTGKTPYWGYHMDEKRLGTHLIQVDYDVKTNIDWGLLGYFIGEVVGENVPVLKGDRLVITLTNLKHFGAAAASSGGVEMYHIVGVTPEAPSMEAAFGKRKPVSSIKFGVKEREGTYEKLNFFAKDRDVDFVMLGCPHYSIDQLADACRFLEGKHVKKDMNLWVFIPKGLKAIADKNGYTKIIEDAGGVLMSDTCPALAHVIPKGTKVAATDSAKQAHYLPAIMGVQTWFGSQEDCIEAAISGKWRGEV